MAKSKEAVNRTRDAYKADLQDLNRYNPQVGGVHNRGSGGGSLLWHLTVFQKPSSSQLRNWIEGILTSMESHSTSRTWRRCSSGVRCPRRKGCKSSRRRSSPYRKSSTSPNTKSKWLARDVLIELNTENASYSSYRNSHVIQTNIPKEREDKPASLLINTWADPPIPWRVLLKHQINSSLYFDDFCYGLIGSLIDFC